MLKEIMDGNQDRADIANKAFDRLTRMGYVEDDIHSTLEVIFSLDEIIEGGIFSSGIHNVVFEIYQPKRRIPVELLMSVSAMARTPFRTASSTNRSTESVP